MFSVYKNGQGSVILRVDLLDTASTSGNGLAGLTSASANLQICTIADNESVGVNYSVTGSTIETITTCGTYAAPTATKCRFKAVDATYQQGLYEIQLANARFAVVGAKGLIVHIHGATNLQQVKFGIPLWALDPYAAGSILTSRDAGEIDRGVALAVTLQTMELEVGTKVPPQGSVLEILDGPYDGLTVTYNNYVELTRILTVDPGFPIGLVGTFPAYKFSSQPLELTGNPPAVELTAATLAAIAASTTALIEASAKLTALYNKINPLNSTMAGSLDSNVTHVNDVPIVGTGQVGDLWRP